MIVVPILTTALPPLLRNSDPKALILIGLCLAPLLLLAGALRATIRRERYGKTYFEFTTLPFSPGKRVSGQIQLRMLTSAPHGVDLQLACIRRIVTGTGKQQTTNEITLWQEQKNVPQAAVSSGPLGNAIPVDFGVPQDAYESNHENTRDQLLWVLTAKADVPGVDYSDKFEVPVFRAGSAASAAPDGFGFRVREQLQSCRNRNRAGLRIRSIRCFCATQSESGCKHHQRRIDAIPFSRVSQPRPDAQLAAIHRSLDRHCLFSCALEGAVVFRRGIWFL